MLKTSKDSCSEQGLNVVKLKAISLDYKIEANMDEYLEVALI